MRRPGSVNLGAAYNAIHEDDHFAQRDENDAGVYQAEASLQPVD